MTVCFARVGDIFKIGLSARLYVFNGPIDRMPQQGMNRNERLMMQKLLEAEKQRERDNQVQSLYCLQSLLKGFYCRLLYRFASAL